jgi:hypothetical protein
MMIGYIIRGYLNMIVINMLIYFLNEKTEGFY